MDPSKPSSFSPSTPPARPGFTERRDSPQEAGHNQPNPGVAGAAQPGPGFMAGGDGAAIDPGKEAKLWSGRTSWKHFIHWVLLWVVISVALFYFHWFNSSTTLIIVAILALAVAIRMAINIFSNRYRLTTQRIFVDRGLLNQVVDQTELIRVDDVRVYKNLFHRILGLGTVEVISTDSTDNNMRIVGVSRPDEVAEAIRTHMRVLRKRSLFVENL